MSKYLIVNGDDFGMCHSVNTGIVECFTKGILTQASLMAPCPWFEEACALAKQFSIPVGVHLTITCDFDMIKWRPLTGGRSITDAEGFCYVTIEELKAHGEPEEIRAELAAQIEAVYAKGLKPVYLESHVGIADDGIVAELCREYGLKSRDPVEPLKEEYSDCMVQYDSFYGEYLSNLPPEEMITNVKTYIEGLGEGIHSLSGNPAVASDEMKAVCSKNMSQMKQNWAEPFRVSFLKLFTSRELVDTSRECGVELVALEKVFGNAECGVQNAED